MLLEIIKSGENAKASPLNSSKISTQKYSKTIPLNTKDKRTIETFNTEYKMYWHSSGCIGDEI